MRILLIVGTRPQLIKLASLTRALDRARIGYGVIHTGQHYEFEMDRTFFEELELPEPLTNLEVGSGSHGWQTGMMLTKLEKACLQFEPALVIVPGDTNSALAGGLAAAKLGVHVAHVEAGLRSRQRFMAEEINRVLLDHLSSLLFAPTETAYGNLLHEGIGKELACLTGDVMADNVVLFSNKLDDVILPLALERKSYIYATIHRAENLDDLEKFKVVVKAIAGIPEKHELKVVFPVHPHTRDKLNARGLYSKLNRSNGVCLLKPVSYLTSLRLARDASMVLTDSGGLQKESFMLGTPVITVRETTEWVETVECGWNILTNIDINTIDKAIETFRSRKPNPVDPIGFYGQGKASEKIAGIVKGFLETKSIN